jgi:YidC/Oxa1 family membrane protein insertase
VLTSFRLKRYTDDYGQPLEMIPQISSAPDLPLSIDLGDKRLNKIAQESVYTIDSSDQTLGEHETGALSFLFTDGTNTFHKRFEFKGESYLVGGEIDASTGGNAIPVRVSWSPGLESPKNYKDVINLKPSHGLLNNGSKVEHFEPKDIKEFRKIGATVRWAGVENSYFMAVFIPRNQPADAYMNQAAVSELKTVHNCDVLLAGQRSEPLQLSLYIGPKDYVMLQQIGLNLEDAINFGFFSPIAKALFFILRYFYTFTGNYGWAIVLLTILIKIIFTPFTQMSFTSMKKMQVMQPELKKIQDKYAKMKSDDPRKLSMNTEIMQLHKRYGVNPLGGCLPMLLQMPVLFAFYGLLGNAIELRKAPFMLWLQDLSRADPLHITPLIMGGTMLLQQRMTPTTDPMQKNMMYIMPIMFTWISFKLQSGLVLYWLLSNALAIAHQYYFQRQQKTAALKESPASS